MALTAPDWIHRKYRRIREMLESNPRGVLLSTALQVAVPLRVHELLMRGGPRESDWDFCRDFAWELGSHGDALLYREKESKHSPGTANMFNGLARAIAIMAFVPGGVEFFGTRYHVSPEDAAEFKERRSRPRPTIKRKRRRS